jgi:hypothetical protein
MKFHNVLIMEFHNFSEFASGIRDAGRHGLRVQATALIRLLFITKCRVFAEASEGYGQAADSAGEDRGTDYPPARRVFLTREVRDLADENKCCAPCAVSCARAAFPSYARRKCR